MTPTPVGGARAVRARRPQRSRTRTCVTFGVTVLVSACGPGTTAAPTPESGGSHSIPPETAGTNQSGAPAPTPSAGQTERPGPTGWDALIFDRSESPATLGAIVATGDRLVGVGGDASGGAVWTLDPGGDWERQGGVPPHVGPTAFLTLVDVVRGPAGLVALGLFGAPNSEVAGSVIWTSADAGATWVEVARLDGAVLGTLAVGDPGILALGAQSGVATPVALAIWSSHDGAQWRESNAKMLTTGGVRDAVWTGDRYVAVGHVQTSDDQGIREAARAAAWSSADGSTWEVLWDEGAEGTFFEGVGLQGDGLVAVGVEFDARTPSVPRPQYWRSADGSSWQQNAIDSEPAQILQFAASDRGFIAVGSTASEPRALAAWLSADGATWTFVKEVAAESAGMLRGAVVLEDRIVAVGATEGSSEADVRPIVLTGPLP